MKLLIRKMTESDIPQVAAIEAQAICPPWSEQSFRSALDQPGNLFLVAETENEIAGYCGMYTAADEGEITNVAVRERYRQQGIGSRIMETVLASAVERGLTQIILEVRESNLAAEKLYEKYGFQSCGKRKNFYHDPDEDAVVMICHPGISSGENSNSPL